MINYRLLEGFPTKNVVAFFPDRADPLRQASSNHPHWTAILDGLRNDDPNTYELFDVRTGMHRRMTQLSDRISFDGDNILFDGDVVHSTLSDQIMRWLNEGEQDYRPLVNFWEKIASNPDENSRENLYNWLATEEFSITPDGDIVGYKGVESFTEDNKSGFRSIHSGTAFVDGVEKSGKIPNQPGTVVSMPRSKVNGNPGVGCSYGLHVGTQSYAKSYGSVLLEVHVNPQDVVSVPSDESFKKMRVWRYKVVQVLGDKAKYDKALVVPAEDYGYNDDYDDVGYETY